MQKLSKLVLLLRAVAVTCSAAPTGLAPKELKASDDVSIPSSVTKTAHDADIFKDQYFLLSPLPILESLAESGHNVSAWYPNQTYLDIHGHLTINEREAVRFIFIGTDNEKLELVAERNRTLAIGVDASLFEVQSFQPFHPLMYTDNQLEAAGPPSLQSAEEKCVNTCELSTSLIFVSLY